MELTLNNLTEEQWGRLEETLDRNARDRGTDEASGFFYDGGGAPWTAAHIEEIISQIEEGDPNWEVRSPLSGEWADDPSEEEVIREAARDANIGLEMGGNTEEWIDLAGDLASRYISVWQNAYEVEVVRSGESLLEGLGSPHTSTLL